MSKPEEWRYNMQGRYMTRCHADCDDHCEWSECPQIRDKEPETTGRHCPLDAADRDHAAEWS